MERRNFLQALGAIFGGLVIAPTSIVLPHTSPLVVPAAVAPTLMPLSDTWMAREVLRSMILKANRTFDLIKQPNLTIGSGVPTIGPLGPVNRVMAHQFSVGIPPFETEGMVDPDEFTQRYLRPVAHALVQCIEREKVQAFGVMEVDIPGTSACVVSDDESGMSVRLIRQYNAMTDQMLARFDCLAA